MELDRKNQKIKELAKKFSEVFSEESWRKLEEELREIRDEFYKQTELDDDAWDFVINE